MRKKTLALFLTCVLAAGMLAGCGNKDSKDNNQVENSQGTESAKDDQAGADEVAELIDAIASGSKLTKADAGRALDSTIEAINKALKKGDRIGLVGFGSFTVAKRAARIGRNPQTGKEIKIAAKKVVKFKAGADLAGTVNKGK